MSVIDINFPGNLPQVATADALRAIPSLYIEGDALYYVPEVKSLFSWDGASLADDDGSTVLRPDDITPLQAGRWLVGLENGPFIQAGTGAVSRPIESKMRDIVSVTDFATPVLADNNGGGNLFVHGGTFNSAAATGFVLNSNYWGLGQIQTADGNRRGKFFSAIKAPPASLGNEETIDTAFNGDLSHSIFQIDHRITGVATLGQPATGYRYTPEAYPLRIQLYNSSGWNQSTAGNDGRTSAVGVSVKVDHYGQGDCMAFRATGIVVGTKAGSTSFLANPAVTLFAGDLFAANDGVYLNPREIGLQDNGFDVACVGDVQNFYRTNATGAKSAFWTAYRVQSQGSQPMDNLFAAVGKVKVGIDLAMLTLDFGTNKAAISLKPNDRIYLNNAAIASGTLVADCRTTVFNGDYIEYNSGLGGINVVAAGTSVLQIKSSGVTTNTQMVATSSVVLPGIQAYTSFANDAAAAAGGIGLGQLYRNGSVIQIRVS